MFLGLCLKVSFKRSLIEFNVTSLSANPDLETKKPPVWEVFCTKAARTLTNCFSYTAIDILHNNLRGVTI